VTKSGTSVKPEIWIWFSKLATSSLSGIYGNARFLHFSGLLAATLGIFEAGEADCKE
jgi:hypothetical protein